MGLDLVEVLLEIENAFKVRIQDEEYERCATVGGMRDLVVAKLQAAGRLASSLAPCLSSAVFCKARKSLVVVGGVDRGRIRPSALVEQMIPVPARRQIWREWERALGVRLPRLERPSVVVFASWAIVVLIYLTLALLAGGLRHPLQLMTAGIVASLAGIAAIVATKPFAVLVPVEATTFRDLTSNLIARHATSFRERLRPQEPRWTSQEAYFVLKGILVEQLGVEPQRVTPEARLIEDLGAD
jgi:acyl carrier protein